LFQTLRHIAALDGNELFGAGAQVAKIQLYFLRPLVMALFPNRLNGVLIS
jgi:hypothetical protein